MVRNIRFHSRALPALLFYSIRLLSSKRSAPLSIDELPPDFNLKRAQSSESQFSEPSGLSQQLEDQILTENTDGQQNEVGLQQITPETSARAEKPASEKKKKRNA